MQMLNQSLLLERILHVILTRGVWSTWKIQNNRLRGRTARVLPAGCPHSAELNSRKLQTKTQSPGCSPGQGGGGGGGGQWLQMTSVLTRHR